MTTGHVETRTKDPQIKRIPGRPARHTLGVKETPVVRRIPIMGRDNRPRSAWRRAHKRILARDPQDGRYWARTSDPVLVRHVLSQLS